MVPSTGETIVSLRHAIYHWWATTARIAQLYSTQYGSTHGKSVWIQSCSVISGETENKREKEREEREREREIKQQRESERQSKTYKCIAHCWDPWEIEIWQPHIVGFHYLPDSIAFLIPVLSVEVTDRTCLFNAWEESHEFVSGQSSRKPTVCFPCYLYGWRQREHG